jgi:hypothetical protein
MATTHKLLASGVLGDGTAAPIYDPTTGKTGMVKTIILHNTHSSAATVELYYNNTTAATRMLKVSLSVDETFEWALSHMLVQLDAIVLKGTASTDAVVNYFIFGAEEE